MFGAAGLGVLGAWGGFRLTPEAATEGESLIYRTGGGALGVVAGLVGVFLLIMAWTFWRAPYRQRDEARQAIDDSATSPLVVVCSSYELTLVGEDIFRGQEYLWALDATLTNNSDEQSVGTGRALVRIHARSDDDSSIRTYTLPLLVASERDRVGSRGKLFLEENEYLRPRESRTGVYLFLDNDWHGQKPITLNCWPNLLVVDSFGGVHNSSFNQPRFHTQPTPEPKDSS